MRQPITRFQLREGDRFSDCVEGIGGYPRVDEAIAGLLEELRIGPQEYPVIEGMKDVRLCETQLYRPPMRWWFTYDQASGVVTVLHAELVERG